MWRWISAVGAYAARAALGAAGPWIWYYGGNRYRDRLWREFAAPPGLGATLLWALIGVGIVLALRGNRPTRHG
jgi:hypothetical protein